SGAPGCNAQSSPYCFLYSNTAGGLFHFILPHMMLASVSGAPSVENQLSGLSDRDYDAQVTAFTGAFYEDFVQEHILDPVGATATCNTQKFLGVRNVAAVYGGGPSDRTGVLPEDSTGHCAAGGWVISANDLSRILARLRVDGILEPISRARLLNLGPNRVWDITTQGSGQQLHHTHNGDHDDIRAAILMRSEGYSAVLIYNTELGSGFSDQQLLVSAFDNNTL
ncbi:MAG: serine hydrolase, partial [Pseudomonadota bacterium]